MAPAVWVEEEFTEGGLASVVEFIGRLIDVEDDVEGKFGNQLELRFNEVEIIEAGDDVTLDEGRYTSWVKQSNKKNSTNGKMMAEWTEFAKAHDMGPLPSCFYGILMRWRKSTYEFGDDMSPGRAMVPVEVIEEGGKKASKKTSTKVVSPAKEEPAAPPPEENDDEESSSSDLPEALVTAIHTSVEGEGATREMIRRTLQKKAALRTALTAAGGLDEVLKAMEDTLNEDDGTYTRVPDEDDAGGDEDPV